MDAVRHSLTYVEKLWDILTLIFCNTSDKKQEQYNMIFYTKSKWNKIFDMWVDTFFFTENDVLENVV